jgi:hypothetical protein
MYVYEAKVSGMLRQRMNKRSHDVRYIGPRRSKQTMFAPFNKDLKDRFLVGEISESAAGLPDGV